ncbi:NAD-dependent succinate-semialdehyde dehydrogenase [Crocinitomix catalasitica]|uniref:NAD-dependent succinate-semialdehyde dehydrogenase n=1 Tax=Crocinitomix catalasitica TaxID=184607 RepID=UPI000485B75B|nr:NAD-dependent succinate-semialdehyde dehydrogenase [Crocinitomix catalasitica]
MAIKSINPYNGEEVGTFTALSSSELNRKLALSQTAFNSWKKTSLAERTTLMAKAGNVLRENVEEYALMITLEMGKPISESRSEVNKCAWVCDYYAENAADFLANEIIETDAQKSFVQHDPLGPIFAVMPWNFPFWQVFRFAAPTLTAGNTGLLKHASNVFGCAQLIESVFIKAGFPEGVFQNLIVHHDSTEQIISHDAVKAVTLTGSEGAGSAVAAIAGKYIKKSILELGGNNAFIVWDDADIDKAVEKAVTARMLNCGQSCIAAKRFILMEGIYDEFVTKFTTAVKELKTGDPQDASTEIGPLARKDLADELHKQVKESIAQGAELLLGGEQDGAFHEPTILGNVTTSMPAFKEETFGPLAAMIKVKTIEEAFELSEQSRFGLGVTVCTENTDKALKMASEVSDGAYFINELVKSDPRLPFGGTKYSGYGRELSKDGMMEFVNRKTVYLA